ncbi:P-loop containing nucleoside triphosphate hydrolase protein [Mycena maculata]|uniref:P-loop containing nucleoside triphosphate hydrolase protein n=1 Tax=Mycena maculata TaxID=230809 RepID=A0AAD7KGQ3_9AGAR|nr:P-loop containing nucleoside triphosphate hydrolase protein [Mycena maculata]
MLSPVSVALMGGTGTGKTTFVNLVGRAQFLVGHGLESCTNRIQSHQFDFEGHPVTLLDVPGFDDTNQSDVDILKIIADFLFNEYQKGRCLSGIMYFHRISDNRLTGSAARNFNMFQKLCGTDAFVNVAIVTTRWDEEDEDIAKERLEKLKTKLSVVDGGAQIFRHDRSYTSASDILRNFVGMTPKPLLIQREMADEGKQLSQTSAGQQLEHEILQLLEQHQREMASLLEDMATSRDASSLKELEDDCQALRDLISYRQAEVDRLAGTSRREVVEVHGSTDSNTSASAQISPRERHGRILRPTGEGEIWTLERWLLGLRWIQWEKGASRVVTLRKMPNADLIGN